MAATSRAGRTADQAGASVRPIGWQSDASALLTMISTPMARRRIVLSSLNRQSCRPLQDRELLR
jgi:hypothetical protein